MSFSMDLGCFVPCSFSKDKTKHTLIFNPILSVTIMQPAVWAFHLHLIGF